mgnify:CR=1 FL=1
MLLDVKLTQGAYWKGTQIPYWLYMALTIFPLTGLLGIDHLLLRSPWTALLKFLTMIPLLGYWYFYDIAQVTGEHDLIEKYEATFLYKPILPIRTYNTSQFTIQLGLPLTLSLIHI